MNGYTDFQKIGQGGYGTVFKARKILDGQIVAIKKICLNKFPKRIEEEIRSLQKLMHRNIVQYSEAFTNDVFQYIVMEYCQEGDLRSYMRREKHCFTDRQAAYVLAQLISAVDYIHRREMMHRDLSTGNVLISAITSDGLLDVKLSDFGLATIVRKDGNLQSIVGTPGFISPQVYEQKYAKETDIYSLGAILYSMLVGEEPPFNRGQWHKQPVDFHLSSLSTEAKELVMNMMSQDARKRIKLADIRNSRFMSNNADVVQMTQLGGTRVPQSRDSGRGGSLSSRPTTDRRSTPHFELRDPLVGRKCRPRSRSCNTEGPMRCVMPMILRSSNGVVDCLHSRMDDQFKCRKCGRPSSKIQQSSAKDQSSERCSSFRQSGVCGGRCSSQRCSHPQFVDPSGNPTQWPLCTARLDPAILTVKTGRYRLTDNKKTTAEFVDEDKILKLIMVVDPGKNGKQMVYVYEPLKRVQLGADWETAKFGRKIGCFSSLSEMSDRFIDKYQLITRFVANIARRVVKLKAYTTMFTDGLVQVMENGDFWLILPDGRRAVQWAKNEKLDVIERLKNGKERRSSLSEAELGFMRREREDCFKVVDVTRALGNPARFPVLLGTPSPRSNPKPSTGCLPNADNSTTRNSHRKASLTVPTRDYSTSRNFSVVDKENISPTAFSNEGFEIERNEDNSLAWVKCTKTRERLRISKRNKYLVYYRSPDSKMQAYNMQNEDDRERLPAKALKMFVFLSKLNNV